MSSLSQALRLEYLPSSHSAFQGHATHIIEWPTMLRPKDSEGTCIPQGVTTFLQAASRRSLRKDWSAKARNRWCHQQRRLLRQGEVARVIAAVRDLCRGRNSKELRKHRDYLIKNQSRMAYGELTALKLPIGSGAIESTVRRVVNLRLKGAS